MTEHICASCTFFDASGPYCRRRAPVVMMDGPNDISSEWPVVAQEDWCGEWDEADARQMIQRHHFLKADIKVRL